MNSEINLPNNPKRKVLILGKLPPPYMGPSVAFELIINSDLKKIYDLSHFDIKANKSLSTLGKWSFSKIITNTRKYIELIKFLRANKPEIVLIPISQSSIGFIKDSFFIFISTCFKNKTLIQLRGGNFRNWLNSTSGIMKLYVKFILSRTNGVIVQGKKLRWLFSDLFREESIFVVPNGGNFTSVTPSQKTEGDIKIIYLGNLQPSKGIEDLIDATAILKNRNIGNFCVQVIGEWRNESTRLKCLKQVAENQIPITFHHGISGTRKHEFLASGDIFVFTPREQEGHPWVIIEAMASGLPIIATDKGAITESVLHGENGFIIPENNSIALAEKLEFYLINPIARLESGSKSKQIYLSQFTENHMVQNYSKVFETVLNS